MSSQVAGKTIIRPGRRADKNRETFCPFRNLIPVTLGNIIGGVLFVGLAYWFIYLRQPGALRLPRLFPGVPPLVRPARKPARRGNKRDEDS